MVDKLQSAELPFISTRANSMLTSFRYGGALTLWDTICELANEDLINPELSVRSSMTKLVQDSKDERLMLQLLLSIPPILVEALILNTVGREYKTNPAFQRVVDSIGHGAGIYINAIVVNGGLLTRIQLEDLQKMIDRYLEQRPDDSQAISIDSILSRDNFERFDTAGGERLWLNRNDATQKLKKALSLRLRPDLDPIGNVQQHQWAIMVATSAYTARQTPDYNPDSGLQNSGGTWELVLSCLKLMAIEYEIVAVPVLNIWKMEQREIAEILITFLAGSLVEHGGYNTIQAGISSGKAQSSDEAKSSDDTEQRQVFVNNPWYQSGLERMSLEVRKRDEILKLLDSTPEKFRMKLDELEIVQKEIGTMLGQMEEDAEKLRLANEHIHEMLKAEEDDIKQETESLLAQIHFLDELNAWLGSS